MGEYELSWLSAWGGGQWMRLRQWQRSGGWEESAGFLHVPDPWAKPWTLYRIEEGDRKLAEDRARKMNGRPSNSEEEAGLVYEFARLPLLEVPPPGENDPSSWGRARTFKQALGWYYRSSTYRSVVGAYIDWCNRWGPLGLVSLWYEPAGQIAGPDMSADGPFYYRERTTELLYPSELIKRVFRGPWIPQELGEPPAHDEGEVGAWAVRETMNRLFQHPEALPALLSARLREDTLGQELILPHLEYVPVLAFSNEVHLLRQALLLAAWQRGDESVDSEGAARATETLYWSLPWRLRPRLTKDPYAQLLADVNTALDVVCRSHSWIPPSRSDRVVSLTRNDRLETFGKAGIVEHVLGRWLALNSMSRWFVPACLPRSQTPKNGPPTLRLDHQSLVGALYHLLAMDLSGGKDIRRCADPKCGVFFRPKTQNGARYHNKSCRSRRGKELRKQSTSDGQAMSEGSSNERPH